MFNKRFTGKVTSAAVVLAVLGALLWAVIAIAAVTVGTYQNDYATPKTLYGRGLETVYTKMAGGIAGSTYYAELWGPTVDQGTTLEMKMRSSALTATSDGFGTAQTSYVSIPGDTTGFWQARFVHNPNFTEPGKIKVLSPLPGATIIANTAVPIQFQILDKNGAVITTDMGRNINVTLKDGATVVWRTRSATRKNGRDGWAFSGGTYTWTRADGTPSYLPLATDNVIQLSIVGKGALGNVAEPGDSYQMGSLVKDLYWKTGNPPSPDQTYYPYSLNPVDSLNPKFIANPLTTTISFWYYFDILDFDGTPLTSDGYVWTRTATEANDYDGNTAQDSITGTAPEYDATAGHWKTRFTLPAPGKYGILIKASKVNAPSGGDIIHFSASSEFEMSGDVTPPGEVTGYSATPGDRQATLDWTNPGDSDFLGVLILRDNNPITDFPTMGQEYSLTGEPGKPNTIGSSKVSYLSNGVQHVDGDPCNQLDQLVTGVTYYYKAFAYDDAFNYSAGTQVSATPFDSTPPGQVTGLTGTHGDGQNTISWTNPTDCDFDRVVIRFRTDGFPPADTDRDGSEGSELAGTVIGGSSGGPGEYTHTNLSNGLPYYYKIWTRDDDGNWNEDGVQRDAPPYYYVPMDSTKPGVIDDLTVVPGSETAFDVTLRWTATGDDGASGNAKEYEIHYWDQAFTNNTSWDNGWMAVGNPLPVPLPSGTVQQYTVSGLRPLSTYYFAIRAIDEAGNWGDISTPTPSATTLCNEQLTGCNQCHLMPPNDGLPGAHPRGTGNVGAHYLPIHTSGGAEQCNVCHANGEVWRNNTTIYEYNHQNDVVEMNDPGKIGNLFDRLSSTGGTFHRFTTVVYKFKEYSSGVGYKQKSGYCSNTYCHGTVLVTPNWGLDSITCGETCHETPPATGRHVKHYHPGLYYYNFGPAGTQISGYTNQDETGWTNAPTTTDRGSGVGGNADKRYATILSNQPGMLSQKTFNVPNGTYYVTVCIGDPAGASTSQNVDVSGDGGLSWIPLISDYHTTDENLFKKVVDVEVVITNNLTVRIGNGTQTHLNYMIINTTPEAPKSNTTVLMNTAAGYGFTCGKCHTADATQAKHTDHVNGFFVSGSRQAEIAFDANSFPKNPLGAYTSVFGNISAFVDGQAFKYTTGRSCKNLYCHGNTLQAGGSNTEPRWLNGYIDVGGASLCGACHEVGYADTTPFTSMSTGSHYRHVNNRFANRIDCYKCHYYTVGAKGVGDVVPITNRINHVDGEVDAYFDTNDNTMRFGRYSTALNTCYNVYCHSNGLLKNNQPFWATEYSLPVWGSGTKQCNYCHGKGNLKGEPDYTNMTSTPNSHSTHAESNGIGCSICHYDTTRDNGLTIYTTLQPSAHVDGDKDIVFGSLNPGAFYVNKQCFDTYCHGLTAEPTWGNNGGVTCGSCHGISPTNPNPGVGAHGAHNNGNHGNISTITANNSSGTKYDFDCRFCHFERQHGTGPVNAATQAAEVNFNLIDVTNAYNNTGGEYVKGSTTYTDSNNWAFTNGKCRNIQCHSDGRGGLPNNTSFKWTDTALDAGGLETCTGCHGQRATATHKIDTGHHPKHVWESVYRKKCEDCHSDTVTGDITINDTSFHNNASPNVNINDSWGPTADYSEANHTCSNVDCHSNAKLAPDDWNGSNTEWFVMINWTSTAGSTCTTCHSDTYYPGGDGVRSAPQTLSYNHGKHTHLAEDGGYGGRYQCRVCHEMTVLNSYTLQTSIPTKHNNQQKDIQYKVPFFNMTGPNTRFPGIDAYWGSWNNPNPGNCTVICHSDGKSLTTAGAPVRFPNWSSAMGSYGCGSCHRDRTNGLNSGSHSAHIVSGGVDCGACHGLTAKFSVLSSFFRNNQEISFSGYSEHHVNGVIEVSLGVGGTWDNPTCSNTPVACHGTGASDAWGSTATCASCHGDGGAIGVETDDWTYGNATKATINTLEWQNVGHGRPTASGNYPYQGNAAANFTDCTTNCHSGSVPHGSATNPFRLVSSATIKPTSPDTLCLSCHDGVTAVVAASHDATNVGQGTWNWTPKCVDCHDPHGDNGGVTTANYNASMIQSEVSYTTSSAYGVPGTTEAVDFPVDWPADTLLNWSSFVNNNAGNKGICRVCHTEATTTYFTRSAYSSHNSDQGLCTSCHSHGNGFKPSSCDSCHGDPPNTGDAKSDNVGAVGGHAMHVTTLSMTCDKCHGHNGSGVQHNESGVSGGYSGVLTPANVDVTISTAYNYGGTATYNGTSGSWSPAKTCSNVSCHYGTSKEWDCQP